MLAALLAATGASPLLPLATAIALPAFRGPGRLAAVAGATLLADLGLALVAARLIAP